LVKVRYDTIRASTDKTFLFSSYIFLIVLTNGSQTYVVYLGLLIAPSFMSDRSERKRQPEGYRWLCILTAARIKPNYTLMI
jgi:hypothetical protein